MGDGDPLPHVVVALHAAADEVFPLGSTHVSVELCPNYSHVALEETDYLGRVHHDAAVGAQDGDLGMGQRTLQEAVFHSSREVNGFARQVFTWSVLHENVPAARLHLDRQALADPCHGLACILVFDARRDVQVLEVVVDEVDGVIRLSVADSGEDVSQAFILEGELLCRELHAGKHIYNKV